MTATDRSPPANIPDRPLHLSGLRLMRDGQQVLDAVSMELDMGERLTITGPNGAGKTTLLRCIMGLERPEAGEIRLFGQPCRREADFRAARRRIGFMFQDSDDQLFCPSVIEDVAFGPLNLGLSQDQARETALIALTGLGIAHLAERFTHRLSGGEKRLVCLAGLLAMEPRLLLLDEPTTGLDTENAARLTAALRGFDGAIIAVSHDPAFLAEFADRALILRGGQIEKVTSQARNRP